MTEKPESAVPKMCPLLSIAGLRQQPSKIIGGAGPQDEAVACQGPSCAWFQPVADDRGRVQGGSCAMTLMPLAVSQLTATVQQILNTFKKA